MTRIPWPPALALLAALASCSRGGSETPADEAAGRAAREYYSCLAEGRYGDFVAGMAGGDSLPPDYRSQLVDMVAQHARSHGGRGAVSRVASARATASGGRARVFLEVHFADSSAEQVCVPMTLECGRWKME